MLLFGAVGVSTRDSPFALVFCPPNPKLNCWHVSCSTYFSHLRSSSRIVHRAQYYLHLQIRERQGLIHGRRSGSDVGLGLLDFPQYPNQKHSASCQIHHVSPPWRPRGPLLKLAEGRTRDRMTDPPSPPVLPGLPVQEYARSLRRACSEPSSSSEPTFPMSPSLVSS